MTGSTSRAALAGAVLLFLPALAAAQDPAAPLTDAELIGDPEAGRELAMEVCGECHGVAPGVYTSPLEEATPFATVAETPGMTARALTVWLTTFHPERTMPAILLDRTERENIIAYIRSLAQE